MATILKQKLILYVSDFLGLFVAVLRCPQMIQAKDLLHIHRDIRVLGADIDATMYDWIDKMKHGELCSHLIVIQNKIVIYQKKRMQKTL